MDKKFITPQKYGAAKNKQSKQGRQNEFKDVPELTACGRCHAVYYDRHWHYDQALYEKVAAQQFAENVFCPECLWIKAGFHGIVDFEGEVLLRGIPNEEMKKEITHEIRNIGTRASDRDPEDQIIKIEDRGETVRVTTTENQLAISIGKQVARAHKGGKLEIKLSREDKPVRVVWNFPQK